MDLDCSKDGSDLNASNSPPRRRRSTFFEKRETLVPQAETETNDYEIEKTPDDKKQHRKQRYLQDIKQYYEKLSKEKEAWKCEARQRRLQYSDMKSQLNVATERSPISVDYSVLTNEDIDFLKAKPNVKKIAESAVDLNQQVAITMSLIKQLKDCDEQVLNYCEEKVKRGQRYILENSVLEPVEQFTSD